MFDLEDATSEWIIAPASAIALSNSFHTLYDFLPPSRPPISNIISTSPTKSDIPPVPNSSNELLSGLVGASPISRNDRMGTRQGGEGVKSQTFNEWSVVKLLEAYDPEDETCASQPYAYVADYIVPVPLSIDIAAEMAAYEDNQGNETGSLLSSPNSPETKGKAVSSSSSTTGRKAAKKSNGVGWFEMLRDQLAKEASIGWYVVVCSQAERTVPNLTPLSIRSGIIKKESTDELRPKTPRGSGLRSLFGKRSRRPSLSEEEGK